MANNGDESPCEDNNEHSKSCKSGRCHYNDHYLRKWLEETSLYGVPHVFKGKSKIRRIIWGIILIGLIVGCIFTIVDNLLRFIKRPTSTTVVIETFEKEGLPFPAVTVCSLNAHESSVIAQLTDFLFNPDLAYDIIAVNNVKTCDKVLSTITENVRNTAIWEDIENSFKNLVYFCGYLQGPNNNVTYCQDKLQPVLTSLGVCFTFNSITNDEPDRYVTATGAKYGLKIIFNISQINHPPIEGNTGIKIIVHERDDIARPNLYGFGIPPGRNAYIGVRKKIDIDHTSNAGCIDDRELTFYPQYRYSQFACHQNARIKQISQSDTCNCILDPSTRPSSGHYSNTPICTFNDTCCLLDQYSSFDPRGGCPLPCQFKYYDNQISYSSFPTGRFLEDLAMSLNTSEDSIRNDFMSVNIYFEDLQVTTTTTEYSYPFTAFIANVGGAMAFFVGASLIAFIEIGMLIADELKRLFFPRKCKEKLKDIETGMVLPEILCKEEDVDVEEQDLTQKENEA